MRREMVKRLVLGVMLVCLLALSACGNTPDQAPAEPASQDKTAASTDEASENVSQAPEEPAKSSGPEASEMIGSGDLGDFYVEIKSADLSTDYEENPAIIITYSWTNNSDETTSAMVSISEKAFQDGVELDTALIMSDNYDSSASMKDVRPGSTIDVQCAFALSSQTSEVEFELSELFSFSKSAPKVVKNFTFE